MSLSTSLSPYFFFEPEVLDDIVERHRGRFQTAEPFPHLSFDDFLPPDVIAKLVEEFPKPEDPNWEFHGPGPTERREERHLDKLAQSNDQFFPPFIRHFMSQLLSQTFLHFLEALTGYDNLIPDPTYNHCGLHSTGSGGRLMIHTDFDRHPFADRRIIQVLNLILFLNPDWKEEYGGHLELRTAEREEHTQILPIANRVVLFYPGPKSFHGHPEPLTCPLDLRRNSLALYYYRLADPNAEVEDARQMSVRWVPTSEDDFTHLHKIQERAGAMRRHLAGRQMQMPAAQMPCDIPKDWGEVAAVDIHFFDIDGLEDAQRQAMLAGLENMRGQDGLVEKNLTPFAVAKPVGREVSQPVRLILLEDGGVAMSSPDRGDNLLYLTDMVTFSNWFGRGGER